MATMTGASARKYPNVLDPLAGTQSALGVAQKTGRLLKVAEDARMAIQLPQWSPAVGFSDAEWSRLRALRERYGVSRDLFNQREMARLSFLRWLYRAGRLRP